MTFAVKSFQSVVKSHSKREKLEVFNMNHKSAITLSPICSKHLLCSSDTFRALLKHHSYALKGSSCEPNINSIPSSLPCYS